jgi:hypothetical protein
MFSSGSPLLTTEEFPFDLDTTSLGFTVTKDHENVVHSVMDEMLDYINDDGIIQVSVLNRPFLFFANLPVITDIL